MSLSLSPCPFPSSPNSIQTCTFPNPGALRKVDISPRVGIGQLGNISHPCQSTGGAHLATVIGWGMNMWLRSGQWNAKVGFLGRDFWKRYFWVTGKDASFLLAGGVCNNKLRNFCGHFASRRKASPRPDWHHGRAAERREETGLLMTSWAAITHVPRSPSHLCVLLVRVT